MKRFRRVLALACAMLLLGGCGDRMVVRELDELELIRVIALDSAEDGRVRVTVFGSGVSSEEPSVFAETAYTVGTALARMQTLSEKYLFFGHADVLLLGEEAARSELGSYHDYLTRDVSIRLGMRCFIVKGGTASEAMEKFSGADLDEFLNGLERDLKLVSESYAFTIGDIASGLAESGAALAAALELREEPDVVSGAANPTLVSAGYGLFTDDGLVGFLDAAESQGANAIINRFEQGHFEVGDGHGGVVGLAVNGVETDVEPLWSGDELLGISLKTQLKAAIEESENEMDMYDSETLVHVRRELESLLEREMSAVVELAGDLGADFLLLGRRISIKNPIKHSGISGDWDEILRQLPVEIEVTADIERTFDLTQPMGSSKAELGEIGK